VFPSLSSLSSFLVLLSSRAIFFKLGIFRQFEKNGRTPIKLIRILEFANSQDFVRDHTLLLGR
jgi:hypothetical protein